MIQRTISSVGADVSKRDAPFPGLPMRQKTTTTTMRMDNVFMQHWCVTKFRKELKKSKSC